MANFAITDVNYEENGYVLLQWESNQETGTFYSWRVYRRTPGGPWKRIAEITNRIVGVYSYRDYLAPANQQSQYAVVYVRVVSGSPTEGSYLPTRAVEPRADKYWLIHPSDPSLSMRLERVTGDSYTREVEEEELLVIGRGRKIDRGESWGISGELSLKFEGDELEARENRVRFEELFEDATYLHLRNPFGDVTKVALFGGLGVERVPGVGTRDFTVVTVGYREVY